MFLLFYISLKGALNLRELFMIFQGRREFLWNFALINRLNWINELKKNMGFKLSFFYLYWLRKPKHCYTSLRIDFYAYTLLYLCLLSIYIESANSIQVISFFFYFIFRFYYSILKLNSFLFQFMVPDIVFFS